MKMEKFSVDFGFILTSSISGSEPIEVAWGVTRQQVENIKNALYPGIEGLKIVPVGLDR